MAKQKKSVSSSKCHASQRKRQNHTPSDKKQDDNNKPRNLLLLDATGPITFSFPQYGSPITLTFDQTADEATWPGGAVWDLGWIMARFICGNIPTTTTMPVASQKHVLKRPGIPTALLLPKQKKLRCILELGCGVGVTGIVAAAALHPSLTILTDLSIVIERVTQPNVRRNTDTGGILPKSGGSKLIAMPLCWGNQEDEQAVWECMGGQFPELLFVGDVAYQHKPGAPSHFDALVSTLVRMTGPSTLIVMGVRIRMPASIDLVHSMAEHFAPVAEPIAVDAIEPRLVHVKHNMSIHFFRKKKQSDERVGAASTIVERADG